MRIDIRRRDRTMDFKRTSCSNIIGFDKATRLGVVDLNELFIFRVKGSFCVHHLFIKNGSLSSRCTQR